MEPKLLSILDVYIPSKNLAFMILEYVITPLKRTTATAHFLNYTWTDHTAVAQVKQSESMIGFWEVKYKLNNLGNGAVSVREVTSSRRNGGSSCTDVTVGVIVDDKAYTIPNEDGRLIENSHRLGKYAHWKKDVMENLYYLQTYEIDGFWCDPDESCAITFVSKLKMLIDPQTAGTPLSLIKQDQ